MHARLLTLVFAAVTLLLHAQNLERQLDEHVLSYVALGQFSGAILVAQRDNLIFERGYGLANREWELTNTPQTKFRLGSVTKQFTAALVLKLEEMGKLKTDDPVSKYVPDCPPAWEKVTIHHLLSHCSGIPSFTSLPDYLKTMHAPSPPEETLKRFRDKPLEFQPGSKFAYSNSGYVLLGYIIEKVTGKTYEAALTEYVLEPLELKDTGYDLPQKMLKRRASGYTHSGENAAFIDMTIPHAAGALYSAVQDLWKWDKALYTDKLLTEASRKKMFTHVHQNYAYGWDVSPQGSHKRIAHGGGINGFASFIARYPDDHLTVIALGNNESAKSGKIAEELAKLVFGEKVEKPATHKEVKIAPELFDAYAGKYELAPDFILTFWREGDLFWSQATGQPKIQIFAESETKFFVKEIDAQITFVRGTNAQVSHLILHQNGQQQAKRLP